MARSRAYAGWYAVAYSVLTYALIMGTTVSSFGLFVLPVSAEFGLSRADMNMAIILLNTGSAIVAPFIGWLLDRVTARTIISVGALLFGVGLTVISVSRSLPLSIVMIVVPVTIGVASAAATSALIVRHFSKRRSGALTLGAMGLSLGGIAVAPIEGWLISSFGWRSALLYSGIAAAALLIPAALPLREPAATPAHAADTADRPLPEAPLPMGAFLHMPSFYLIALGISLPMAVAQSLTISLVPLALGTGMTLLKATGLVSIGGMVSIGGKLLLATIADRFDRALLLIAVFAVGAAANVALLLSSGYLVLALCAGAIGLTNGALNPLFNAFVADRYGRSSFGTAHGLIMPVIFAMCAIMARVTGEIYDRAGSYSLALAIFIALQCIAITLIWVVRKLAPTPARGAI